MNSNYPSYVITHENLAQQDSMVFNEVSERQYEVQSNVHLFTSLHNPEFKDVLKCEELENVKVKQGDATIEGVKGKFTGEWQFAAESNT